MANLNKVFLMGNLTRDPELRYTPSGTAVCEFGLAINRRWTTPDGEKREETCFVDCQMWGRRGEVIAEYLSKGKPLFVEGRLQLDQWEGKDGQRRSKMRVVADNFEFLGGRGEGGSGGRGGSKSGGRGDGDSGSRGGSKSGGRGDGDSGGRGDSGSGGGGGRRGSGGEDHRGGGGRREQSESRPAGPEAPEGGVNVKDDAIPF